MSADFYRKRDLYTSDQDTLVDLKEYLFKLLPKWPWFAIAVLVTLLIAFLFNRYTTPLYPVSGTLMIQDKQTESSAILEELGATLESSRNIDNEIEILRSYSMIEEVVDSLDLMISYYQVGNIKTTQLYKSAPVKVQFDETSGQIENLKIGVLDITEEGYQLQIESAGISEQKQYGELIAFRGMVFSLKKNDLNFYPSQEGALEVVFQNKLTRAMRYKQMLTVKQLKRGSSIIEISATTANPALTVDFINVLMDKYISQELKQKNETSIRTIAFIDNQLGGIQNELFAAESQLETFRAQNKIVDISQAGISAFEQLQDLENQLATLEIEKKYYEYLEEYLKNLPDGEVVTPSVVGVQEASLNDLITRLNDLHSQQVRLQSSASEFNPQLTTLTAQIKRVVETINENVSLLINAVDIRIKDFEARIELNEQELNLLPGNERKLVNIQRRFSLNENLYIYLLEKKAEASIVKAGNVPTSRVVDQAVRFSQVTPKSKRNYFVAIFLGVAVPFGVIVLMWYFDSSISSMEEIVRKTKLPIVGSIALSKYGSDLILREHSRSVEAESFRTMRSNIRFLKNGSQNGHVIMLTSFLSGEGKTFSSINLASSFAVAGYNTLLIALDLRKRGTYQALGADRKHGMTDYLIEDKTLEEIIKPTNVESLDFINAGSFTPNPNELLLKADLAQFFQNLRDRYQYIIIDTSPVGMVSDPLEIGKHADTTLFVTRQGKTPKQAIEYINQTVETGVLRDVSIIFNAVDFSKMGYRYGYKNGYSYSKYFDRD